MLVSIYTMKLLISLGTLWKHVYSLRYLIILSVKLLKKYFSAQSAKLLIMMMLMSYFFGMFERRMAFSLISSGDHCQRSSPLRISGAEPVFKPNLMNLGSSYSHYTTASIFFANFWNILFQWYFQILSKDIRTSGINIGVFKQ